MTTITLDAYKIATSRAYINSLLGTRVAHTTPAGTRVEGVITRNPMSYGISSLAVTSSDGKWASIGHSETLELLNG